MPITGALRVAPVLDRDFDYNLGRWGNGTAKYYFAHDDDPGTDPNFGTLPPTTRQRALLTYSGHAVDESDADLTGGLPKRLLRHPRFLRNPIRPRHPQPSTFFDANKFWDNWSLESLASPRINPFWDSVERLLEVRLIGYRQQIGSTPLYYESESTVGYYGRVFANTNNPLASPTNMANYYGGRADTFHQLTLPETFFGLVKCDATSGRALHLLRPGNRSRRDEHQPGP